jgi:hypothetical protein
MGKPTQGAEDASVFKMLSAFTALEKDSRHPASADGGTMTHNGFYQTHS